MVKVTDSKGTREYKDVNEMSIMESQLKGYKVSMTYEQAYAIVEHIVNMSEKRFDRNAIFALELLKIAAQKATEYDSQLEKSLKE